MSSVLILTNEEQVGLVTMPEIIEAMEIAYRELGDGVAQLIPRYRMQLPKRTTPEVSYFFNSISAAVPAFNTAAIRLNSASTRVRETPGRKRKEYPGDYVGVVLLFDIETNELRAILFDHYMSPLRVAATSAVVARRLAREGAATVGLFGSGEQARAHAEAMCAVRPIRRISVYSPTRAHREAFAAEMTTKLDIEVVPVAEPGHAVQGCEIVVEATNANEPVFEAEWLEPGTHVVTIRGSDRFNHQPVIDFEGTARRAGIMITDYREQIHLDDQRELLDLLEQGKIRWEDLHDIADLVAGRAPRRQSPDEITVHFHNTGMGVQFAALGALMERKARERGNLGRELPTEWFITVKGDAVWSP